MLEHIIMYKYNFFFLFTIMPPAKSPIWNHFLLGKKQNKTHARAHCRGCIEKKRPKENTIEMDDDGNSILTTVMGHGR